MKSASTYGLRMACLILIALGLLAAGYGLLQRVRAERSAMAVELVVDYQEVAALASAQPDANMASTLARLGSAGATAVAIPEETIPSLILDGLVRVIADREDHLVITTSTPAVLELVRNGLAQVYPPEKVTVSAPNITIRGTWQALEKLGLGLDPSKVKMVTNAGLHVVPRLSSGGILTADGITTKLAALDFQLSPYRTKFAMRPIIIFDGNSVLGYRQLVPQVAEAFETLGFSYGDIEFGKQKGGQQLATKLKGRLVRVHSISVEELSTMSAGQAAQRYALAVKDRNIRVLYVHMLPLTSADPVREAAVYVNTVAKTVRSSGAVVNIAKAAHPFDAPNIPWPVLAMLFAGAGAGLLGWLLQVLPVQLPRGWVILGWLALGVGVVAASTFALMKPDLGRDLFGLCAAIGFPMLGLTWAYRKVEAVAATGTTQPLFTAVKALLVTTSITLVGALLIAAMMTEARYLVHVEQFTGVKLAMAVPLLFFGLLVITDGVARNGESFADYCARTTARLRTVLAQPVYLYGIIAAMIGLAIVGLVLARSGNDSGLSVSSAELQFRSLLERVLIARPRTKEFLFGHPFFLAAIYTAARGWRLPALLLLLAGAIGQVDVLNTYCHAHTPVLLSLLRTANGLWIGVIVGVIALAIVGRVLVPKAPATDAAVSELK